MKVLQQAPDSSPARTEQCPIDRHHRRCAVVDNTLERVDAQIQQHDGRIPRPSRLHRGSPRIGTVVQGLPSLTDALGRKTRACARGQLFAELDKQAVRRRCLGCIEVEKPALSGGVHPHPVAQYRMSDEVGRERQRQPALPTTIARHAIDGCLQPPTRPRPASRMRAAVSKTTTGIRSSYAQRAAAAARWNAGTVMSDVSFVGSAWLRSPHSVSW